MLKCKKKKKKKEIRQLILVLYNCRKRSFSLHAISWSVGVEKKLHSWSFEFRTAGAFMGIFMR